MYMTEFIVIARHYIFLLLKLRITFVPFLTAGSAANTQVNDCHSFTNRDKNPMQQPRDSTQVEKSDFFFSRKSVQVVLTLKMRIRDIDSVVVVYLTFVIIAFYGQVQHMHQSGSVTVVQVVHATDLTSLVDSLPRET